MACNIPQAIPNAVLAIDVYGSILSTFCNKAVKELVCNTSYYSNWFDKTHLVVAMINHYEMDNGV